MWIALLMMMNAMATSGVACNPNIPAIFQNALQLTDIFIQETDTKYSMSDMTELHNQINQALESGNIKELESFVSGLQSKDPTLSQNLIDYLKSYGVTIHQLLEESIEPSNTALKKRDQKPIIAMALVASATLFTVCYTVEQPKGPRALELAFASALAAFAVIVFCFSGNAPAPIANTQGNSQV
eukprot:NODE_99_length_20465_cov_0.827654.p14 type:complete len:184 gc:universal NODE_99_length_20465_cov_0.827654:5750-5199(-)